MKLKSLAKDSFTVAAVMVGEACPTESFIMEGEATYEAARDGIVSLLLRVASTGLAELSAKHSHLVDKTHGIYEFIKGDLRLFYFKGKGDVVVVCTAGVIKKGQKVDKRAVAAAIKHKEEYIAATDNGTIEWQDQEGL